MKKLNSFYANKLSLTNSYLMLKTYVYPLHAFGKFIKNARPLTS
jgi:hypothetical protein